MEREHGEGDVGREEVNAGREPGPLGEAEKEEQPQETAQTEMSPAPLSRPACETPEEPAADRTEKAGEEAGKEVPSPSPVTEPATPEVEAPPSFAGAAEDQAGRSLGEGQPEAVSRDDQERTDSAVCEPAGFEAARAESGAESAAESEAPKPPKKTRARRKTTPHKRTDKARRKPAKKRSGKRPAKKREKSQV